jgi:hypothetical protein
LVLCVKTDEVDTWRGYAKACGRESDLVVVEPGSEMVFDFLAEQAREDQKPLNVIHITQLILDVFQLYSRDGGSGRGQDSFWLEQLQTCLNHAIILSFRETGRVSAQGIISLFRSALNHAETFESLRVRNQKSAFERLSEEVVDRFPHEEEVRAAIHFYLNDFKNLAEKTRSIVVAMFGSLMEPLIQYPLREVLTGKTTVTPGDAFNGKIIVINLPIHRFRKTGLLCQLIFKMTFMNAVMERRDPNRPVFLWADESQYFIEERDIQFLTTARSQRCSVVYLTQNISNYEASLGAQAKVSAILGSLNAKIYHQNNDPKTNQWATNSIGKTMHKRKSVTKADGKKSETLSEGMEHDVPERVFTGLKNGGDRNKNLVQAILHIPGMRFPNGSPWYRASFKQI